MRKFFLLSLLLTLWGTATSKDITGDGKEVTINISEINSQGWTSVSAGTGWTISMDVENPNGVSFGQYGSSIFAIGSNAFPEKNGYRGLQLYLQSSTNGGKLDAVFDGGDHTIDNVTYTGNFSAVISYNGKNQLQIKTTNASGTVAVNDYILNNTLAEFSQLSYGLPTGINVKNLQLTPLSKSVDYPTAATVSNGKYTFTSNKILYDGNCNKIRFTLTESAVFYKNGKKRMSFDSFVLRDAGGNEVELKDTYFTGNNTGKVFANMLDGENGTHCSGTWETGTEDDWFEITLPNSIDLGGAFSFSFVTENTTMNAKAFIIAMSYEAQTGYTFSISGNGENEVTIKHGEEELTAGSKMDITDFNADNVTATEIPGYTWNIVVDHENKTITLVYTEAAVVENPDAVVALITRIGGAAIADKFKFILDPSLNSKQEVFVLGNEDGKILIKGTTISAITTGLGWYLNNVAKVNIAWNALNETTLADNNSGKGLEIKEGEVDTSVEGKQLSKRRRKASRNAEPAAKPYFDFTGINLPLPSDEEVHVSDAKYRYYLNTCTFGYSMTSWQDSSWKRERLCKAGKSSFKL